MVEVFLSFGSLSSRVFLQGSLVFLPPFRNSNLIQNLKANSFVRCQSSLFLFSAGIMNRTRSVLGGNMLRFVLQWLSVFLVQVPFEQKLYNI